MISSNEAKQKQEHQEIIESISSDLEGLTTSIAINYAQDVIQELKDFSVFDSINGTISTGINDIDASNFQAAEQDGTWIETIPAHEQEAWWKRIQRRKIQHYR